MRFEERAGLPETANTGDLRAVALEHWGERGGIVDLTIGDPCDTMPDEFLGGINSHPDHHRYPRTAGIDGFVETAEQFLREHSGAYLPEGMGIIPSIGTKGFIGILPLLMRKLDPNRPAILYPELSYPTVRHSLEAHGTGSHEVPIIDGQLDLGSLHPSVVESASCLVINSPNNPTGQMWDFAGLAEWARGNGILLVSDESYMEFGWDERAQSVLEYGHEFVIAIRSLTKGYNFAGARCGVLAGDPEVVDYMMDWNKLLGFIPGRPAQLAAMDAMRNSTFAREQTQLYRYRLTMLVKLMREAGYEAEMPAGGLYLWVEKPDGVASGYDFALHLANRLGMVVTPGLQFGAAGHNHVRIAPMQPTEKIEQLFDRIAA